ncbi:hypothetical protein DH2020_002661 [Rehmannia glutinosa]|uniref:beta-N-acetylhexosaminidase n=1 Tax=Rehmannia glutinosa TaxID=99300 RepID=A0ABR0XUD9_REHGL
MGCLFISTFIILSTLYTIPHISAVGYPINVWPKPTTFHWPRPQAIALSPNFIISAPGHRYLTPAVHRYLRLILTEHHRPLVPPLLNLTSQPLAALTVTISDAAAPLTHGVNESYSLTVPCAGGAAVLKSETPWGAMRGLETFSQLVYSKPSRVACGLYIFDVPLFMHRGIMLDTSRNYYGVGDLMRLIRAISMNKLNVFHWHITDSHSFPLVVPSEPEMAAKGAYGEDMKYTAADVKRVVEYGLEHGVRVVPEIDMPAHTGSWAEAYPEIITCANKFCRYNQPPGTDQEKGGSWCGPFKTWQLIYNYDITYGLTEEESKLVLGGRWHCGLSKLIRLLWIRWIWPRASQWVKRCGREIGGERGKKRFAEATDRLNEWRYRMVTRELVLSLFSHCGVSRIQACVIRSI